LQQIAYSSSGSIINAELAEFFKKKPRKKRRKYTELLQGNRNAMINKP
jgi:hypothetical protein